MQRILLVANPTASSFTGALHRRVRSDLGEVFEVVSVWPTSPEATRQMAAEAAADGFFAVVAMGGDGVVHHVANGLANTSTALGIIPAGTTNVVARILGLPGRPGPASRALKTADLSPMLLAHLATDSGAGARSEFAVFAAGIGYDADMVDISDRHPPTAKNHFGSLHYARAAAGALLGSYRRMPANLRIECDGERMDAVALMVQVHDPFTYFGRVPLRFTGSPGEALTVVGIESLALRRASAILARAVVRGDLDTVPGVRLWRDPQKIVVQAEPSSRFQSDGEALGSTDWLEITPVPDGLNVLTPAGG